MEHFTAHRLCFVAEVQTPIELNEHKGSAIRGALYHALRTWCANHAAPDCRQCSLAATCPVCTLVSTLNPDEGRGSDVARPYTIEPPLGEQTSYVPGEALEFGLTMFAEALNLFPYVILAVQAMERSGLGKRVEANGWRRGTFRLRQVRATNPLTGQEQPIVSASDTLVHIPDIPITHAQVLEAAAGHPQNGPLTMTFLTPTRITDQKHLLHRPAFRPIFQRLLERLSALARHFSDTPMAVDFRALVGAAERVRTIEDGTRWVELRSYSTRQGRATPTSGFLGAVTFEAEDWGPFLPCLIWGQFTHVGKDAVKGNGWYVIE